MSVEDVDEFSDKGCPNLLLKSDNRDLQKQIKRSNTIAKDNNCS